MKNILLFIVAALTIVSCQKQTPVQENSDTDLGYGAFKYGEVVTTLYGGKTIDVGTVTVGIDDETDYIYVKYETTDGWYIAETHVFVGTDGSEIPVNKPGNPKIGHFPYSTSHDYGDGTNVVTYPTIPYVPGQAFVVATHAVVYTLDGQQETAWSWNDEATRFSGKRWGWFLNFSYNGQAPSETSFLYITQYIDGVLYIYQLNLETGGVELISQEEFDAGVGGSIEGASWDPESNMFLFVSGNGTEIWGSNFDEDTPVNFIGNLDGIAVDGTFLNNTYYFVDENNQIWAVVFDADMQILSQTIIGSLDAGISVLDMAISPDGQNLYFVTNNNNVAEIWMYNLNDGAVSMLANLGNSQYQIAFDEDGDLQAIEETAEEDNSIIHDINENTGEMNNSTEINVDVEEVTTGPRI